MELAKAAAGGGMEILHVVPYFALGCSYGGTPVAVRQLVHALSRSGEHEITVYTTDAFNQKERARPPFGARKGRGFYAVQEDHIQVYYFRNLSNRIAFDQKLFLSPGIIGVVRRDLRKFDVIHLHEFRTMQNVVVYHYARQYGIPYVLSAHGSVPRIGGKRLWKAVFDHVIGLDLLNHTRGVIALSDYEKRHYERTGVPPDYIQVIPHGIDGSQFADLPDRGLFRKNYGLEHKKIILYLGRIHKVKGIDVLIKAFREVAKEKQDVVLVIAGYDGHYKKHLKALINRIGLMAYDVDHIDTRAPLDVDVLFTGPLMGTAKLSALVDADVFVYPSSFEAFGLASFEALMCGTPAIVAQEGGCGEWVRRIQPGRTALYEDLNGLKNQIVRWLEESGKAGGTLEESRSFIRSRLTWNGISEEIVNIYKQVA